MPKYCQKCPEDDKKRARYGYRNGISECCSQHKEPDMINLSQKLCNFVDEDGTECCKKASFNIFGEKAELCTQHKTEDMINVTIRLCSGIDEDGIQCTTRPSFNIEGEKAEYCAKHKTEEMVDVKSKRCQGKNEDGSKCTKRATFGNDKQKNIFCCDHKTEDMLTSSSKRCTYIDEDGTKCTTQASFGYKGQSAERCKAHKESEMRDVKSKLCEGINEDGTECTKRPCFGNNGEKQFCAKHKTENMTDVVHPKCNTPFCDTVAQDSKYKGYCAYCYSHLFPDDPIVKNIKTKENTVTKHVAELLKDENVIMTFDKHVGGCSQRRPDVLIEMADSPHAVMVEVDENGHKGYDTTCENKRICQLYEDLAYKNIVVIRFNPDGYYNSDKKRVKSPWKVGETGKVSIVDKKDWKGRINALDELILYWIKNDPGQAMKLEYLCYDGYQAKKEVVKPKKTKKKKVAKPTKKDKLGNNETIWEEVQNMVGSLGDDKYVNIQTLRANKISKLVVVNEKYKICVKKSSEEVLTSFVKWLKKK